MDAATHTPPRRRGPKLPELALTEDERATLQRWARRAKSGQALALRCRIVLACAEGASNAEVVKRLGVSPPAISRIWRAFGLKPHLVDTFKLSTDPQFVEKVRDVVGLYLNPPEAAMVLCVDEKTQVQALDRTAPTLPLLPGTPQRATHDYTRHGVTNLYAALDVASGKVISQMTARHRAVEFKRFLAHIGQAVPAELAVHV